MGILEGLIPSDSATGRGQWAASKGCTGGDGGRPAIIQLSRRLERDFPQGLVVIGQGGMALSWRRVDLRLDIGKKFFALRVVRPCHTLP